jgi:dihydrolipoamide dehydrogenase
LYDLIVIGGGPAGYRAAELAGGGGLNTLLIEKKTVGGVCLNEGCIPTKTFLYSAKIKDNAEHGEKYGVFAEGVRLEHKAVVARKNKVVKTLVAGVKAQLRSAGVTLVFGEAKILGRGEGFDVKCGGGTYEGKRLLIAAGSVPAVPPVPGLKEALESGFAVTSREILDIETIPESLVIIGGGIIGLEMAAYFTSAGSEVTVVEMLESIGGGIDSEIAKLLKKNFEKKGVKFMLGCKVNEVKQGSIIAEGAAGANEIACSLILLSAGRRPNTEGLGLESIGVLTEKDAIITDENMKTNIPGVYAAGDVNGKSMLAHTAYREAEAAVNNMRGEADYMDYRAIPGVIYTNPEVAWAGETEESAKAKNGFRSHTVSMRFSGRYLAENEGGDGIAKIIVHNNGRIAGFHMIGSYASEIIYGACMMIGREMAPEQARKVIFPHPTVSEIIKECVFQIGD